MTMITYIIRVDPKRRWYKRVSVFLHWYFVVIVGVCVFGMWMAVTNNDSVAFCIDYFALFVMIKGYIDNLPDYRFARVVRLCRKLRCL